MDRPDEDAAKKARTEYVGVWKSFGKSGEGERLVQQKANVVVGLDDENPPTPEEAKTLDGCVA